MPDEYQSKKCSLGAILRNDNEYNAENMEKIQKAVKMCDRLWTHCLLFIKAFLLKKHDEDRRREETFPKVDNKFVLNALRVLAGIRVDKGDAISQQQKGEFHNFFVEYYRDTMPPEEPAMSMKNMTQIMAYLSQEVVVCYETNIKRNWQKHLTLFVNDAHRKMARTRAINEGDGTAAEKKAARTELFHELEAVKRDLMNSRNEIPYPNGRDSLERYHEWIDDTARIIMPPMNRLVQNDNVMYDVAAAPQDYLYGMICMGEFRQDRAALDGYHATLLNVLPMKTSITPRSIRLDSTGLQHLIDYNRDALDKREGTLMEIKFAVWNRYFRLEKPIFSGNRADDEHGFRFDHQIQTDGISATVVLKRTPQEADNGGGQGQEQPGTKPLTSITPQQRTNLAEKILIGVDPGLSDLMYCTNGAVHDAAQVQFRYTQNTRRKVLQTRKNQKQLQRMKASTLIDDRPITAWEAEGANINSRTCRFDDFIAYLQYKNRLNMKLRPFYSRTKFRRQKLTQYRRNQQADMRLLQEFKMKFHGQVEASGVVVAFGDWEQKIHRYHEPTKGKGLRKVFEKAGYHVFLINEYGTSRQCSKCSNSNAQCEKFRQVPNPRPWRDGQILCHGLVRCTTCWTMWNRDVNAVVNIWKIANAILAEQQLPPNDPNLRPAYLRRNDNANN